MYVLALDGWTLSEGIKWEMEIAKSLNIPTLIISPEQIDSYHLT